MITDGGVVQGSCEYVLARTKMTVTKSSESFSIATKNIPCGEGGVVCTKAVHITMASVRIRLVLGAAPSLNEVALSNGRTTFSGGEIDVNDMFHYVKLQSGVEVLYDRGTNDSVLDYNSCYNNCHCLFVRVIGSMQANRWTETTRNMGESPT